MLLNEILKNPKQLIIKFLFFESDFNAANSSGVKFQGTPFSMSELSKKNAQSLILVLKLLFSHW